MSASEATFYRYTLFNYYMEESEQPDWLPAQYDVDAPLQDRLPIMAEIEGGIELHVGNPSGVVEVVHQPQHFHQYETGGMRLDAGTAVDDWEWEIVISEDGSSVLKKVDPMQDVDVYEMTKRRWLDDVDVRIYGVDIDRLN